MATARVALLRGINVGKAKRIAMADLKTLVERLGYGDVRTLLNSGNVVFTAPGGKTADDAAKIEKAIEAKLGLTSKVTVLTGKEVADAVKENPLAKVATNPSLLLVFVPRDAKSLATLKPLVAQRWAPEALALGTRVAYVWCPNGSIDSRVAAAVNKTLGDAVTARNIATMSKLAALAGGD